MEVSTNNLDKAAIGATRSTAGSSVGAWFRHGGVAMWRFATRQPLGTLGLIICVLAILAGVFGPFIAPYGLNEGNHLDRLQAPSTKHLLGTDEFGRDVFSRIVYGARISLYVAFFSIGIGVTTGYLIGIMSGYVGGRFDLVLQRVVDAMMAFPAILLALIMVAMLGPGLVQVITAISIVSSPNAVRLARGTVLAVKENAYIDASRAIGASPIRIMLRHVLPNSMAPFLIITSVALGGAILTEASLSYLGLGVPPPFPSWGKMLSGGAQEYGMIAPWMVIAPGLSIMLIVLGFNLFGDALRDILDPRLRGR